MSITVQDVEALRSLLATLPRHEAREVTKQEAVALLAGEIRAAQRRGYPPEEIARILSERGVPINVATLRGYLRRTRKVRKSAGSRAKGDGRGQAAVTRNAGRPPGTAPVEAASADDESSTPTNVGIGTIGKTGTETPRTVVAPTPRR